MSSATAIMSPVPVKMPTACDPPVILNNDYSDSELAFLMGHETDSFNRWEAGQQLALRIMQRLLLDQREGRELQLDEGLAEAFGYRFLLDQLFA